MAESLPDSVYGSEATAIAVNGNDVYIAGYIISPKGHHVATVWRNGTAIMLDNSGLSSGANGIALNGNDLYIAGFSGPSAVYWKNGLVTKLTFEDATSVGSGANAITIVGADVYVAGGTYNDNGYPIAIYWKNGVGRLLPAVAIECQLQRRRGSPSWNALNYCLLAVTIGWLVRPRVRSVRVKGSFIWMVSRRRAM